jgi:hypothetical protein
MTANSASFPDRFADEAHLEEFVHAFRQVPGDITVLASVGKIRPDFGATRSARGT